MDSLVNRGQSDVKDKLDQAKDQVREIGESFDEVKTGLSDMPGGLDADLAQMILDAQEQGKQEAAADVEGVKQSMVRDAKGSADTIKSEVTEKINDNQTAQGKIAGISSKYGKSALDAASQAISENTNKGNDLMAELEKAIQDADNDIASVKDSL